MAYIAPLMKPQAGGMVPFAAHFWNVTQRYVTSHKTKQEGITYESGRDCQQGLFKTP